MSNLRASVFLLLLLLGGCQSIDFHPYTRGSFERLSQDEIRQVLDKFKVQMARAGLQPLPRPNINDKDFARFGYGWTSPYDAYLDLAYTSEDGFVLKFSRITMHSPLTDSVITDYRLQTEQIIFDVTSKKVPLRVYVEWPKSPDQ